MALLSEGVVNDEEVGENVGFFGGGMGCDLENMGLGGEIVGFLYYRIVII